MFVHRLPMSLVAHNVGAHGELLLYESGRRSGALRHSGQPPTCERGRSEGRRGRLAAGRGECAQRPPRYAAAQGCRSALGRRQVHHFRARSLQRVRVLRELLAQARRPNCAAARHAPCILFRHANRMNGTEHHSSVRALRFATEHRAGARSCSKPQPVKACCCCGVLLTSVSPLR
jgi:hypothetical protein